jgi:hypothetical protein
MQGCLFAGSTAHRAAVVLVEEPDPSEGDMLVGHDRPDDLAEHGRRVFRLGDRENYGQKVHDISSCEESQIRERLFPLCERSQEAVLDLPCNALIIKQQGIGDSVAVPKDVERNQTT